MNWKDPWIHQLYFPVSLGKLQKRENPHFCFLAFHPTSAANRRESVKVIGLAQEAVMQGRPQEEGGAARSPCPLSGPLSCCTGCTARTAFGPSSSEAGMREVRVRRSHSSLCCKTVVEYTEGFMTTHIPHFPCTSICW